MPNYAPDCGLSVIVKNLRQEIYEEEEYSEEVPIFTYLLNVYLKNSL